jgi:hypothetical protein
MEDSENIPPRVDLFARLICLVVGSMLAICAYHAFSLSQYLLFWPLAVGAAVTLIAGFFGPRSLRIGLVSWMPWF